MDYNWAPLQLTAIVAALVVGVFLIVGFWTWVFPHRGEEGAAIILSFITILVFGAVILGFFV